MLETYAIDDVAGLMYLARSCEALVRLRQAQRSLKKSCVISDKKGSIKAHPAVSVEKESHRQFLECMKMLNLDVEPTKSVGRPPGPGGPLKAR